MVDSPSSNTFNVKNTFIELKPEENVPGKRPRACTDTTIDYDFTPEGKRRSDTSVTIEPVQEEGESDCETEPEDNTTKDAYLPPGKLQGPPGMFSPVMSPAGMTPMAPPSMGFPMQALPMQAMAHAYAMQAASMAAANMQMQQMQRPRLGSASSNQSSSRGKKNSFSEKGTPKSTGSGKQRWADATPDASALAGKRPSFGMNDKAKKPDGKERGMTSNSETSKAKQPDGRERGITSNSETSARSKDAVAAVPALEVPEGSRTTVILRNLPTGCTRTSLLGMLDWHGFALKYNFIYMPTDFKNWIGFGYAFVNFTSHLDGAAAMKYFKEREWEQEPGKVCDAVWSMPHQGWEAHIERYRNSPVMHEAVPDEAKPMLFDASGKRMKFPAPTKRIKPPRMRGPVKGEGENQ